jgi:DNA-binding transcriptional LysR family regulator/ABC-type Fe3+ transport system substrate-binding protein
MTAPQLGLAPFHTDVIRGRQSNMATERLAVTPNLNLNDLRLFVEIVEHQGILRAGRALGLPKSTVSRRLAGLEEQLKVRLVLRTGESFALTAAGQETYALARRMVEAARQAEERLLAAAREVTGQVVVSVSPMLATSAARAAAGLCAVHPGLALHLDLSDRPAETPGDGSDLWLRAHVGRLRDSPLIQRRICRTPLVFAAAPGLRPPTPEAVPRLGLLAFGADPAQTDWPLSGPEGAALLIRARPRLAGTDPAALIALAEAGSGVALLPEAALAPAEAEGRLTRVLPGWTGAPVTLTLLSPPRHAMSPALRHTADALAAAAKAGVLGVPQREGAVPELRPVGVTRPSHAAPTPQRRAAPAPHAVPTGGDPDMTPFRTLIGSAALGAAAGLSAAQAQDAAGPLVLYTNDFEGVITERFEADTGREIDVVQMSGGELLARIAAESANPQWDVLIFNGSYTFEMLDRQGQLKRGVAPANLDNLNELGRDYLTEGGAWFPIGLAASCVMLYRTDLVETPPAAFEDLAEPPFEGMFGMADPAVAAPAYPCVAAFFETMGEEAAKNLFNAYFENGMRVFRTNGPVGRAIESGEISVALITSQVAYTVLADGAVPVNVVWPETGAPGVVRGAAISSGTGRPEAAQAFVEWLLEPQTQSFLAEAVPTDGKFEPTVTGAVRRADGPPEGVRFLVASDGFAVEHEAEIKTWFADQALN